MGESLTRILNEHKIVISAGSGGVGKTTVAAALALQGARMGKRVLVMTIDPAKRLANSLGLPELGNRESRVPPEKFREAGIEVTGEMHAMLLDTKRTFDDLVERFAPNEDVKRTIYANRFYKNLSSTMSGSNEFLAIEKLYDVYDKGAYDLIILDTPPTKHAIEFLESPKKMSAFLSEDMMKWFLKPYFAAGKLSLGFMGNMVQRMFRMLEWATGIGFLKDVSEFFISFEHIFEQMYARMNKVEAILHAPETIFVLVTSPRELALEESEFFYKKLAEMRVSFGGFVINRVNPDELAAAAPDLARESLEPDALAARVRERLGAELEGTPLGAGAIDELADTLASGHMIARGDTKAVDAFRDRFPQNVPFYPVPRFERDVYDFEGLLRIDHALFGE
ncbi:MAG: ArsA family ATPase [Myxococcales bacterium]|nr:ArsA family ATPase [Myxococcales bacterium]